MRWNPHLTFDGRCEEAFRFYETCLRATISFMMRYVDSPLAGQVPPAWADKIIHATLSVEGHVLTGADALPNKYQQPEGISVLLHVDGAAEADRVFTSLAENGSVQLPLQETFWALRFGMVTDQFGTPWTINCGKHG